MGNNLFALAAAAAAAITAPPATAREVKVTIDSAAGPWTLAAPYDKQLPYGAGGQKPPTVVPFDVASGEIVIYPEGTTDTPDAKNVGPAGIESNAVNDTLADGKLRYPSFYAPKLLYPANQHELMVVFLDDKGGVLTRPLIIAKATRLPIPDGAAGLAFGFNDVNFSGNTGALTVTVVIPD